MALMRIQLELARTPQYPEGSRQHGYELIAPLDPQGHLDADEWRAARKACTVRRFWGDDGEQQGELIHRRDGKWAFSYAPGDDDDEPIFRLDKHVFRSGEYVSVTEHDGETLPFRVVDVRPVGI